MSYIKTQKASKGYFTPKNPEKYAGEYPIRIMSSWERSFMQWCDMNSNVTYWSSEPLGIPYINPTKINSKRTGESRYYPDFLLKCKSKSGEEKVWLVEVKPYKDIISKTSKNKSKKTVLYEQKTQLINKAKFKAAKKYCDGKGWIFKLITEKELFGK